MPRYMLLLRGNTDSESGSPPSKALLTRMHAYNASLHVSGALLSGEGLHASSSGARVIFPPPDPKDPTKLGPMEDITVTPGPFPCEGENRVVCGFWIIAAGDLEEAVQWARKAPVGTEVEVRRVHEMGEFEGVDEGMMKESENWRRGS